MKDAGHIKPPSRAFRHDASSKPSLCFERLSSKDRVLAIVQSTVAVLAGISGTENSNITGERMGNSRYVRCRQSGRSVIVMLEYAVVDALSSLRSEGVCGAH